MILREEYEKAHAHIGFRQFEVCVVFAMLTAATVGVVKSDESDAFGVVAAALLLALVVCVARALRCRRVIRAWRDERRVEAAIAEARKDGDA
jgi:hypothetical protein